LILSSTVLVRNNKILADRYDVREDLVKFMMAKEKIVTSLYDIQNNRINESFRRDNSSDPNMAFNYEMNRMASEAQSNNNQIHPQNNDIPLIESELIDMFHQKENVLQNTPGNFSIVSTHHDIKFEK